MNQQLSFAQAEYAGKKKTTRWERFLAEMEKVVPWARLCAVIEPHYPAGKRGRPHISIAHAAHLLPAAPHSSTSHAKSH